MIRRFIIDESPARESTTVDAVSDDSAPPAAKVPWLRVVISFLLAIVIIAALVWFIRNNVTEYEQGWSELSDISTLWLVLLVGAGIINILAYPFTVLVAVPQLSYGEGLSLIHI